MPQKDYTKSPNFALVFTNRNREKESDPDYTGHGEVLCGKCGNVGRYWLSGWKKVSQKAGQFLSLSFKDKDGAMRRAARDEGMPWDN